MNRDVHEISIGITDSHLGIGRSIGTFLDLFIGRLFANPIQSFIHVFHLYAEMIQPVGTLLFRIV
jgi:hypothetical protein